MVLEPVAFGGLVAAPGLEVVVVAVVVAAAAPACLFLRTQEVLVPLLGLYPCCPLSKAFCGTSIQNGHYDCCQSCVYQSTTTFLILEVCVDSPPTSPL